MSTFTSPLLKEVYDKGPERARYIRNLVTNEGWSIIQVHKTVMKGYPTVIHTQSLLDPDGEVVASKIPAVVDAKIISQVYEAVLAYEKQRHRREIAKRVDLEVQELWSAAKDTYNKSEEEAIAEDGKKLRWYHWG